MTCRRYSECVAVLREALGIAPLTSQSGIHTNLAHALVRRRVL